MPPKRKSDAFETLDPPADQPDASGSSGDASGPVAKKARGSDVGEGLSSAKKGKKAAEPPKEWFEVVLEGEDEVSRFRDLSVHTAVPSSRMINEVLTMRLR